jgi:hypothetical protein
MMVIFSLVSIKLAFFYGAELLLLLVATIPAIIAASQAKHADKKE